MQSLSRGAASCGHGAAATRPRITLRRAPAAAAARQPRATATSIPTSSDQRRCWQRCVAAAAAAEPPQQQPEQQPQRQEQPAGAGPGPIANPGASIASDLGFKAFVSEAEWRKIDEKVNKYPGQRTFNAIGTGDADFRAAMLAAVESVVGAVHVECVSSRPSRGGKYISVRIGPVWVETADQVIQVYANMRQDSRLKWFM